MIKNVQDVAVFSGQDYFKPGESIYINKVDEQAEPHVHAHDFIEIAYVAAGAGTHRIGGREYAVAKGDLFIINTDTPHEFRSGLPPKPALTVCNCVFKPEFFDYRLINATDFQEITGHFLFRSLFPEENILPGHFVLVGKDSAEIEQIYEKMLREYTNRDTGTVELLRAYVIELLVLVARQFKKTAESERPLISQRKRLIETALKYMMENYSKDIRLEDLSMMSFFSRNYFCRLFKETTGMTAFEYIQKLRIQEACSLLSESGRSVQETAALVGYRDIKFFNEVFKRYMGMPPSAYVRKKV